MRRLAVLLPLVLFVAAGCQKSTTNIIQETKSADSGTRLKAVRTLGQRRDDRSRVIPALIDALEDEDDEVRKGAAYSLGTFGEDARDAVPALRAMSKDSNDEVRKAAGVALKFIEPEKNSSDRGSGSVQ